MPHGQSWFSILPGFSTLYQNLLGLTVYFGRPFNDRGETWVGHQPISMQHVIGAALTLIILAVFAVAARARAGQTQTAIVPESRLTLATFVELFVSTVYGMMSDIMGPKAARFFLPLIGTCAFFIFFSNMIGLVPGFLPPTNTLNTTAGCAIIIFVTTHVFGIKEQGFTHYFAHFFGPIRKWYALPLMVLMFCIEIVSHVARPVSLAVRLAANMFADHLVVGVFLGLVPFFVPIPIMLLGVLVCVVQTLVFCLLSCVYISMAIANEEH